ncbi:MAG: hypothetical protein GY835_23030 [bacterium]|nr:hypothetical protein [bacterium]
MNAPDSMIEEYIKLALAMDQHLPGYSEIYYGPKKWKDEISQSAPQPLSHLAQVADRLYADISESTEFDKQRRDFLGKQLRAMSSLLGFLQGDKLSVREEGRLLYEIVPQWTDEAEFNEAHRVLDDLLPAGKTLYERTQRHKEEIRLSIDAFERLIHITAVELHRRTIDEFPLPKNDSFEFVFVNNKPWPANHYYLGNSSSRVEINTDLPFYVSFVVYMVSHDLYPGHHTEISIKEERLYSEQGREEHCIWPINTPATAVSEGIAERGRKMIMSDEEWIEWHSEVLYPAVGLDHLDAERRYLIGNASTQLDGVYGNAVFLAHDQGKTDDEVMEYIKKFRLLSEEEAAGCVRFIKAPQFRSYYFTYLCGAALLDELFEQNEDRIYWFNRLLAEPVTPGQIRNWIENTAGDSRGAGPGAGPRDNPPCRRPPRSPLRATAR